MMSKKAKNSGVPTFHKEMITVLKSRNNDKRRNDLNEQKTNRFPKLSVGYYVLNFDGVQENLLLDKTSKNQANLNVKCNQYNLNHATECSEVVEKEKKGDINLKLHAFDSLTEINDMSVDMCKEYFSITKVELRNQQLATVPSDVWKLNCRLNGFAEDQNRNIRILNNNYYLNLLNLHPIRVLDLSCNYLKQISSEIRNLFLLQVLNLSNNQLTSLPNELSELNELEEIYLCYNLFQNLPRVLYKLKNLKMLFIKYNYISTIDKEFKYLNQLQILDISQNNLYSWPYPVLNSKTITELNLDNNKISVVPDQIHNMKNLKHLRLRYNHIRRLPKFHKMNSLELTELRNNSIQNFPDFYGSIHLREVWLDNNQIQKIDANSLIGTTIRVLSISSNKLNEINGHFSLLDTLRYLDVSNNELKTLPYDFCKLDNIKTIKLTGNNFNDPNIIKCDALGIHDLIDYIRNSDNDKKITIPEGPKYRYVENYDLKEYGKSDRLQHSLRLTTDNSGHLPNWMFRRAELDEVLSLDLSGNQHAQLPTQLWKTSPYLEELYVRDNQLTKLPMYVGHFLKMRVLDLKSNHLSSLPQELIYCSELSYINISHNQFAEMPLVLYSMKKLETIIASNNKIELVNYELIRKIVKLDMSKNRVVKFAFNN